MLAGQAHIEKLRRDGIPLIIELKAIDLSALESATEKEDEKE